MALKNIDEGCESKGEEETARILSQENNSDVSPQLASAWQVIGLAPSG